MTAKILLMAVLSLGTVVSINVGPAAAQINSTRASTRQTQKLITRIETKIDILKDEVQRVSNRPNRDEPAGGPSTADLGRYLDDLTASVTRMDSAYDARQPIDNELRDAMSDATRVDQFMVQNRLNASIEAQWRSLKRDF